MRGSYHATESNVRFIDKNGRGDTIRVARVANEKGDEYLDIRNYYTNDDGERCPTQKGVRFNTEISVDVVTALLEAMTADEFNEVMTNFSEEGVDDGG
jgi:hypothetical protein